MAEAVTFELHAEFPDEWTSLPADALIPGAPIAAFREQHRAKHRPTAQVTFYHEDHWPAINDVADQSMGRAVAMLGGISILRTQTIIDEFWECAIRILRVTRTDPDGIAYLERQVHAFITRPPHMVPDVDAGRDIIYLVLTRDEDEDPVVDDEFQQILGGISIIDPAFADS